MEYEFTQIRVLYPSEKILGKINQKLDSDESLTTQESIYFYATTQGLEKLKFAGKQGWQIKAVCIEERSDGMSRLYFLERDSKHSNFGKELNDEYMKSGLHEKHLEARTSLVGGKSSNP